MKVRVVVASASLVLVAVGVGVGVARTRPGAERVNSRSPMVEETRDAIGVDTPDTRTSYRRHTVVERIPFSRERHANMAYGIALTSVVRVDPMRYNTASGGMPMADANALGYVRFVPVVLDIGEVYAGELVGVAGLVTMKEVSEGTDETEVGRGAFVPMAELKAGLGGVALVSLVYSDEPWGQYLKGLAEELTAESGQPYVAALTYAFYREAGSRGELVDFESGDVAADLSELTDDLVSARRAGSVP